MAESIVNATIMLRDGVSPASVSDALVFGDSEGHQGLSALSAFVAGLPVSGAKVLVRVDSATAAAAVGTIAVTAANCTAGDTLAITVPGYGTAFVFTAVALDADTTAASGEYSLETATDTAVAQSLEAAIEAVAGIKRLVTVSESSGTLTITAVRAGTAGNNIAFTNKVTSAAFVLTNPSGGTTTGQAPTMDIVFGTPNVTADDTLSVGGRLYTWKASASADGEITLSATEATAATNFAAAINDDATWTGLLSAAVATATVTLTWLGDPRVGQHIVVALTEANAGSIVPAGTVMGVTDAEAMVDTATITGSSVTATYTLGAV